MADYSIRPLEEIPDVLGDYPGEMRMTAASDLGTEQVSFTWRRMPAQTGGKGSYGHRHKTQEEIYFVVSGTLQFKLEDEVLDVPAGTVVRIAPQVVRSVWNEGPDDAVLIMCSIKSRRSRGRPRDGRRLLARVARRAYWRHSCMPPLGSSSKAARQPRPNTTSTSTASSNPSARLAP